MAPIIGFCAIANRNMKIYRYLIAFILAMPMLFAGMAEAAGKDYIKNIEITESDINIERPAMQAVAYLCVTLKNNGDRKISNLNFELKYYDKDDNLIKRAIVKNTLNKAIMPGESQKYKIRLKGSIIDIEHAQYPYERSADIDTFDAKIIHARLAS